MDKIHKVLGPNRDIMAPDVNTSAQVMAWLMDEYGKLSGHTPAIVTGKPIALEGSYGRESATGRGLVYMFREAAPQRRALARREHLRRPGLRQRRLVGGPHPLPAGRADDRRLERATERSARTPASTRRSSRSSSPKAGRSPSSRASSRSRRRSCFTIPCDVLIPAALGGVIHEGNADTINCRMLLEGANSPTTPGADEVLEDKGVLVIPDVMANAGGVVVSYFEWVQNMQHFRWEEREINDKLGNIMRRAFREVDAVAKEKGITLRHASYELGIKRVRRERAAARLHLNLLTDAAARYRRDSARGCRLRHPIASA